MHLFDPATTTWTLFVGVMVNTRPSMRRMHGFTTAGGKLYVHGGRTDSSNKR